MQLQRLHPLDTLSQAGMRALLKGMHVVRVADGQMLFQTGDADYKTRYVLEGRVVLLDAQGRALNRHDDSSVQPIPGEIPSRTSARAQGAVRILEVDSRLLASVMSWDQPELASAEETQWQDNNDWMANFLSARGFSRVPPTSLQAVFQRMRRRPARAGEIIIRQGTAGDAFYVIASGRVMVEHESQQQTKPAALAEFGPGACFGEDALVGDAPRNATVRMLTDGELMALDKKDFVELLKAPLTRCIEAAQAKAMLKEGALCLDVRLPQQAQQGRLPNSINLPFPILRARMHGLETERSYIVVCATGNDSAVATFLLSRHGLDASYLRGGIDSLLER